MKAQWARWNNAIQPAESAQRCEEGPSLFLISKYYIVFLAMRTVLVYRAVTKYVTLKNTVVYKI